MGRVTGARTEPVLDLKVFSIGAGFLEARECVLGSCFRGFQPGTKLYRAEEPRVLTLIIWDRTLLTSSELRGDREEL
jgi:hypothetical protein